MNVNTYIGDTTTTLSRCITSYLSDESHIKQHLMKKYNKDINKLKSTDIRSLLMIQKSNMKIIIKIANKY